MRNDALKLILILKAYLNVIKGWLGVIDLEKRKVFEKRVDICNDCQHKKRKVFFSTCSVCGCLIRAKTRADYDMDENGTSIDDIYNKK